MMRKKDILSYFKTSALESLKILLVFFFASGYAITPIEEDSSLYSESVSEQISNQISLSSDSLKSKKNISFSKTENSYVYISHEGLVYDPENQMIAAKEVIKAKEFPKAKLRNTLTSNKLGKQVVAHNNNYPKPDKKHQVLMSPYSEKQLLAGSTLMGYKCLSFSGQYFSTSFPESPEILQQSYFYCEKEFMNNINLFIIFLHSSCLFSRPPPLA